MGFGGVTHARSRHPAISSLSGPEAGKRLDEAREPRARCGSRRASGRTTTVATKNKRVAGDVADVCGFELLGGTVPRRNPQNQARVSSRQPSVARPQAHSGPGGDGSLMRGKRRNPAGSGAQPPDRGIHTPSHASVERDCVHCRADRGFYLLVLAKTAARAATDRAMTSSATFTLSKFLFFTLPLLLFFFSVVVALSFFSFSSPFPSPFLIFSPLPFPFFFSSSLK